MEKEIKIPEVGESVSEVIIAEWLKKDGDYVDIDEAICEIDSDKASFEIPSEHAGVLKVLVKEGETVAIGDTIARIDTDGKEREKPQTEEKQAETKKETEEEASAKPDQEIAAEEKLKISPVAEKILSKAGISPKDVKGSGIGGRIIKEDALKAIEDGRERQDDQVEVEEPQTAKAEEPRVAVTDTRTERSERREKMTTLRKTISRRLVAAKNETAMLTTFNEVDMQAILDIRSKYKDSFKEKYEVGLGFMSFFTKSVCNALKEWPAVNARIDGDDIVYHDYCDISIAVSTDRGLVTPVVRNADRLSSAQIEREILRLAERARAGKLSIEEMNGGTFTISNGGVFGSLMATPIINPPQSAILGMHKIQERPVVMDGQIAVRPMMYVALSYDHRIVDGRESVSFLVRVKEMLEDPARLLLGV